MFRGEDQHTLDEKGRVFVPAKHREELGLVVVLWRGMDGQINVYPQQTWEQVAQRLGQVNQTRTAVRSTSRLVFAAQDCELDRQGRVLIPPLMRRYAELGSEVVILGHNDHVEIWSLERWQQFTEKVYADNSEISESLAQLGVSL